MYMRVVVYIIQLYQYSLLMDVTYSYCKVKKFGSKKVWQIKIVRSLAGKLLQIEVHFQFCDLMSHAFTCQSMDVHCDAQNSTHSIQCKPLGYSTRDHLFYKNHIRLVLHIQQPLIASA